MWDQCPNQQGGRTQSINFRSEETVIERVIRVRHSAVTTQPNLCQVQGQARKPNQRVRVRLTEVGNWVETQLLHGCVTRDGEALESQLKAALKGKEGQALTSRSIHNSSYQQKSWSWTRPSELHTFTN